MRLFLDFNKFLLLLIFFISAVFISPMLGQDKPEYAVMLIPDSLKVDANTIVRYDYGEINVHSPGKASTIYKRVVTILDQKSHNNELSVFYNKFSKVKKVKVRLYNALGNFVRAAKKSEIKDESAVSGGTLHGDSRYKHIELFYDTYPYTLEFEYEIEYNALMNFPSWYIQSSYNESVIYSHYVVNIPKESTIHFHTPKLKIEPAINKTENGTQYSWVAQNLLVINYEPFTPSATQLFPHILVTLDKFKLDKYEGSMATWDSYGTFLNTLNKDRDILSPGMKKTIDALIENIDSDAEKIEVLYNYLQENTRYVSIQLGVGGWQTYDAAYVEENKYGDCKALTNFMKSMLDYVGIKSYNAYVYAGSKPYEVSADFAINKFNHVILNIPSEDYWLECTSNEFPVNYLGDFTDNRNVLLVMDQKSKLVKTPAYKKDQNYRNGKTKIILNEKGEAIISNQVVFRGPQHDNYRFIERKSDEEKEKWLRENTALTSLFIEHLNVSSSKTQPEAQLDYKIIIPRYASKVGKRLFVPINVVNPFEKIPKSSKKRIHPIYVRQEYQEGDTISMIIPDGYKIESIPKKDIDLDTPFGKYKISFKEENGTLEYTRHLEINAVKLPPSEYQSFRDFYKRVSKADGMKIVLVKKKK